MDQLPERNCLFCGDPFIPRTSKQLYDVLDCRYRAARQKAWEKRQAAKAQRQADVIAAEAARRQAMTDPTASFTN